MALANRPFDSVRDLLKQAEEFDISLTGGAILHDDDVKRYTDELLSEVHRQFGTTVEIGNFEPSVNGVLFTVLPPHKNTGVFLLCKALHIVSDVQYDPQRQITAVTFNLQPPVYFCASFAWVVFLYVLAAACFLGGDAFMPATELVHAFS